LFEFTARPIQGRWQSEGQAILTDDSSGSSLNNPGEPAFDLGGDLRVANCLGKTMVEYKKKELAVSDSSPPKANLTSIDGSLGGPWAAAFDARTLWINNFNRPENIIQDSASQLKKSGALEPTVFLTDEASES
jgi:hypothetical protein